MHEFDPTELDHFARWQFDAGGHSVVSAVNRWRRMSPRARAELMRRWREEDEKRTKKEAKNG